MEYAIVWLLFGIVCGVIAETRGLGPVKWFVIGLLIGPFGVVLVLVLPPNEKKLEEAALEGGKFARCPYCAELIRHDAIICKHCGREVTKAVAQEPVVVATPSPRDIQVAGELESLRDAINADNEFILEERVRYLLASGYDGDSIIDIAREQSGLEASEEVSRVLERIL
jgi:hypothetical protein